MLRLGWLSDRFLGGEELMQRATLHGAEFECKRSVQYARKKLHQLHYVSVINSI